MCRGERAKNVGQPVGWPPSPCYPSIHAGRDPTGTSMVLLPESRYLRGRVELEGKSGIESQGTASQPQGGRPNRIPIEVDFPRWERNLSYRQAQLWSCTAVLRTSTSTIQPAQ